MAAVLMFILSYILQASCQSTALSYVLCSKTKNLWEDLQTSHREPHFNPAQIIFFLFLPPLPHSTQLIKNSLTRKDCEPSPGNAGTRVQTPSWPLTPDTWQNKKGSRPSDRIHFSPGLQEVESTQSSLQTPQEQGHQPHRK